MPCLHQTVLEVVTAMESCELQAAFQCRLDHLYQSKEDMETSTFWAYLKVRGGNRCRPEIIEKPWLRSLENQKMNKRDLEKFLEDLLRLSDRDSGRNRWVLKAEAGISLRKPLSQETSWNPGIVKNSLKPTPILPMSCQKSMSKVAVIEDTVSSELLEIWSTLLSFWNTIFVAGWKHFLNRFLAAQLTMHSNLYCS